MKTIAAIWAGKLAKQIAKLRGGKGSAIPGVVGLKINGNVLEKLAKKIPQIIFVTATNGKTTTSNLLAGMFRLQGKRVLCNSEGANMITGVTAAVIDGAGLFGTMKYDVAVIEVDEASLPKILAQVSPKAIVIGNFFRDQLDRFGEMDVLINHMKDAIHKKTDIELILNTDDPFVMRFNDLPNPKQYFGIAPGAYTFPNFEMSDSKFCPNCQKELVYSHTHYGQLGVYACACGFKRAKPDVEIQKIKTIKDGFELKLKTGSYKMTLPGVYNAYNGLGAITAAKYLGVGDVSIAAALSSYKAENGRMQKSYIGEQEVIINLIKNPTGANATLGEIARDKRKKNILLCLNDLAADGRDVSWIWDVDFELAKDANVDRVICSGRRAGDMAVRIRHAGISEEKIEVIEKIEEAFHIAIRGGRPTYMMPTYTNLEPIQSVLKGIAK